MIWDIPDSAPDHTDSLTEPLTHLSGSQLCTLHPMSVSKVRTKHCLTLTCGQLTPREPWRTGYDALIYLFQITSSARKANFIFPVSANVAFPFAPNNSVQATAEWQAWLATCNRDSNFHVRDTIAMALLTVQA